MDMDMKYIYMPLHMAELQINETGCNISRMFSSDQVGCTSISQVVQLLENKGLFIEVLTNVAFVLCSTGKGLQQTI